ncbi:MAG: hypothetical protein NW224_25785 [Leptolyngbyaceae cyanobacterium bins.302]|nr:hypothetical protein [Leptolyngbyaceae cyanobacterium bins.302]
MSLNEEQSANLARFQRSLPKNASSVRVYSLPNDSRAFQADVPARNVPGSFATYEKQIDQAGVTLFYTKTTYAPDGSIVHVKQKFP